MRPVIRIPRQRSWSKSQVPKTDRGAAAGAGRGARVSLSRVGVAGVSRCAGAGRRHPPPLSERGPQPPHARYSRNSPLSCTTVSFWPGAIP